MQCEQLAAESIRGTLAARVGARLKGDPLEEGDPGASVGVGGECRLYGGVFGGIYRGVDACLTECTQCLRYRCFT